MYAGGLGSIPALDFGFHPSWVGKKRSYVNVAW